MGRKQRKWGREVKEVAREEIKEKGRRVQIRGTENLETCRMRRRRGSKGGGEVRKRRRADILITNDVLVRLRLPLAPVQTHHEQSFMILKLLLTVSLTNSRK